MFSLAPAAPCLLGGEEQPGAPARSSDERVRRSSPDYDYGDHAYGRLGLHTEIPPTVILSPASF